MPRATIPNAYPEGMEESPYARQRESVGKQMSEVLVPLAALAAGAYALHKGTKWGATDLLAKNMDDWIGIKNALHATHRAGQGSAIHQILKRMKGLV